VYNGQLGTLYEASGKLYLRYTTGDGSKKSVFICPASGEGKLTKAEIEQRRLEILKSAGLTGQVSEETKQGITFKVAGESWLNHCMTRKRNPIARATAKGYRSYLNKLYPMIGDLAFAQITNKAVKNVNEKLIAENLSGKTIGEILSVITYVIAAILDEDGEQMYPRTWNWDFIDRPVVGKQNQPSFTPDQVTTIISTATGRYAVLYALLAGSGMRIGEVLAIELGPQSDDATTLSKDCKTIFVRKSVFGQKKQNPKTQAAIRDIDVHPELAALIKNYVGDRTEGLLFPSASGLPLLQRNILRDSLHRIENGYEVQVKDGKNLDGSWKIKVLKEVKGATNKTIGFHGFRRFRATHLRAEGVPEDFVMFWMGHKEKTITDRYSKMKERLELRKKWAETAGLGFKLPVSKIVEIPVECHKKENAA
jgi:integrase